ncbi:MAG: dGTPase, partial [Enterobacterales bacterium]|nr:dGTPase [Enterobacterales bacterium]
FCHHLESIVEGAFNEPLIDDEGQENRLLDVFKNVARSYVFNHHEVEQLELQGYRVITGLLDIYSDLLDMPMDDFAKLVEDNKHKKFPIETRLFHKLSGKHLAAYREAVKQIKHLSNEQREVREYYYRARLIQDYISGMTDLYAYDEYRRLMAAE